MQEHAGANIYLLQSCSSKQILRSVLLTLKLKSAGGHAQVHVFVDARTGIGFMQAP